MSKFKKGELTKESLDVIMHDIGCLEVTDIIDNRYHLNLLIKNLKDIWGN